jgi:hypothetical protein
VTAPAEPGLSVAPISATDRGRKIASRLRTDMITASKGHLTASSRGIDVPNQARFWRFKNPGTAKEYKKIQRFAAFYNFRSIPEPSVRA